MSLSMFHTCENCTSIVEPFETLCKHCQPKTIKHNVKSPVLMDYHASMVIPGSYQVYRKVTDTYLCESFGLEFGLITLDGRKHCVVRRLVNGNWQHWESIKLANYL